MKNKKVTLLALIILFLTFSLGILVGGFFMYSKYKTPDVRINLPMSSKMTDQKEANSSVSTMNIYSPDDKKYASIKFEFADNYYAVSVLNFSKKWNNSTFPLKKDGSYSPNKNHLSWSKDSKKLAVIIPGSLIIFKTNESDGWTYEEIAGNFDIITSRVFFAGDDSGVYVSSYQESYLLSMFSGGSKLTKIEIPSENYEIYPVPNQSGFAYWQYVPYPEKDMIVIKNGSKEQKFSIAKYDYPGKILLSSNLQKVCLEGGSSGYYGYLIASLTNNQVILDGPQYSKCIRWLDSERIVISENVWDHSVGNPHFYLFNTITKTKELLLVTDGGKHSGELQHIYP